MKSAGWTSIDGIVTIDKKSEHMGAMIESRVAREAVGFAYVIYEGPRMTKRGSGVILHFGGGGPQTLPGLGGFKIALDAVEGLRRQWAIELGKQGIRVATIKTGGITDSIPENYPGRDEIVASIEQEALLNRTATLADVGNVAAFVASDLARTMTSTEVNISCGAIVD